MQLTNNFKQLLKLPKAALSKVIPYLAPRGFSFPYHKHLRAFPLTWRVALASGRVEINTKTGSGFQTQIRLFPTLWRPT